MLDEDDAAARFISSNPDRPRGARLSPYRSDRAKTMITRDWSVNAAYCRSRLRRWGRLRRTSREKADPASSPPPPSRAQHL